MDEIMKAIKRMKVEKAAGHDRVSSEMLKSVGVVVTSLLYQLFNNCWKIGTVPGAKSLYPSYTLFKRKGSRQHDDTPRPRQRYPGPGRSASASTYQTKSRQVPAVDLRGRDSWEEKAKMCNFERNLHYSVVSRRGDGSVVM
ncbi:hypothetical protein EVAR_74962_1 [Eumeta japonica]|uniref:Uncharacterized protein n=1 Tax=Eumeta variegata TaxID=151549 RepID=A0A4C1UJ63_EUMVA|nr:hypothetical protein EVAR_74962_1 [Eumeta japonica]